MKVRTAAAGVTTALLVAAALAGCTTTIKGTPGPAPSLGAKGDFPNGTPTGFTTDEPSDSPSASPTDSPTDTSTGSPSDSSTGSPTDAGSVDTLCSRLDTAVQQGSGVDPQVVQTYVSTMILVWGIANSDDDPYASVDAATTKTCPDTRTAVLKLIGLPDLRSTKK